MFSLREVWKFFCKLIRPKKIYLGGYLVFLFFWPNVFFVENFFPYYKYQERMNKFGQIHFSTLPGQAWPKSRSLLTPVARWRYTVLKGARKWCYTIPKIAYLNFFFFLSFLHYLLLKARYLLSLFSQYFDIIWENITELGRCPHPLLYLRGVKCG